MCCQPSGCTAYGLMSVLRFCKQGACVRQYKYRILPFCLIKWSFIQRYMCVVKNYIGRWGRVRFGELARREIGVLE